MSAIETRKSFTIVRPNLLRDYAAAPHTIVVGGSSRGGTSAISYALASAGLYLGPVGDLNHEDKEILAAIRTKRNLREIFRNRNKSHEVWGFKIPEITFHFDWLDMELRRPIFIFVFRNVAGVAQSIQTRDPVFGRSLNGYVQSLKHALTYYNYFTECLRRMQSPVVIIEYERIISEPEAVIPELFELLGLHADRDTIPRICSNLKIPGYKTLQAPTEGV
jgi:hypothetical protein